MQIVPVLTLHESTPSGFSLLVKYLNPHGNRCPYSEYHVNNSLIETVKKRKLPLKIIKLETLKQAKYSPSPATIFSLFYNGKFITTDISVCMDKRFDKITGL